MDSLGPYAPPLFKGLKCHEKVNVPILPAEVPRLVGTESGDLYLKIFFPSLGVDF